MRVSRACKKDANQNDIVAALIAIGCTVADTSMAGDGFPDLVVGIAGTNLLLEVKDEAQPPSKQRLTTDQQLFHSQWKGPIYVVNSVDQAIRIVNRVRRVGRTITTAR